MRRPLYQTTPEDQPFIITPLESVFPICGFESGIVPSRSRLRIGKENFQGFRKPWADGKINKTLRRNP